MSVAVIKDAVLEKLLVRLVELYRPERVYLFGSRGREEHRTGSDYDLMLVVPDDASEAQRDCDRIYPFLWQNGIATDILIWKRTEFDERLHLKASLPSTIVREGKLLYAA